MHILDGYPADLASLRRFSVNVKLFLSAHPGFLSTVTTFAVDAMLSLQFWTGTGSLPAVLTVHYPGFDVRMLKRNYIF